jgi:hypothetical protein
MSQQLTSSSTSLGIADFLECIGNYEWSMFAVKAPLEAVVDKLIHLQSIQRWQSLKLQILKADVEKRTSHTNGQVGGGIPVVEVHGWTYVPWTACWYMEDIAGFQSIIGLEAERITSQNIQTIPKMIADSLQARVVTFFAEDTDGLIGYQIFEAGESLEHFVHTPGGRLFWQSHLREAPIGDLDDDDDDNWDDDDEGAPRQLSSAEKFVDARFQELEIYVPDCYAVRREADVWLEGNHSLSVIGKAAVLEHF